MKKTLMALSVAVAALSAQGLEAKTLKWAFQGDAQSLDPQSLNETFTLGLLGNIYEGLVRRGPDLAIEPALATSWKIVEPKRWRFTLRKGVTFHNGNAFTADDVVFTYQRTLEAGLRRENPHGHRRRCGQGGRSHRRFHHRGAEPDPDRRMGDLVHHG